MAASLETSSPKSSSCLIWAFPGALRDRLTPTAHPVQGTDQLHWIYELLTEWSAIN